MPIFKDYQIILCRTTDFHKQSRIIMIPITEEEEVEIDAKLNREKADVIFEKQCGKLKVAIKPRDIQFYGEIDFSDTSEDLDEIDKAKWFESLEEGSVPVPSDYDYNTHCCYSPINKFRYTETFYPSILVRYKHACLGKPERVVIFKATYNG